jgi:hypothetical protein
MNLLPKGAALLLTLTCRCCNAGFTAPAAPGRNPGYCSDDCRRKAHAVTVLAGRRKQAEKSAAEAAAWQARYADVLAA